MEVQAILRYVRYSPLKMRKISKGIKENYSYSVSDAINVLKLNPSKGAKILEKLLSSALANAINKNAKEDNLTIKNISINEGPALKRLRPLSRGSATVIRKRTSHIKVVLTDE